MPYKEPLTITIKELHDNFRKLILEDRAKGFKIGGFGELYWNAFPVSKLKYASYISASIKKNCKSLYCCRSRRNYKGKYDPIFINKNQKVTIYYYKRVSKKIDSLFERKIALYDMPPFLAMGVLALLGLGHFMKLKNKAINEPSGL